MTRREWMLASAGASQAFAQRGKLNVLLIAVDDLNTRLGCYGDPVVKTPNIDRLARRGIRFDRAYCNYPVCNASRTSLLSGFRPDKTRILDNQTPPRTTLKDAVFLPEYFHANGYFTARVGKIAHGAFEDAVSWDVSEFARGRAAINQRGRKKKGGGGAPGEGTGRLQWVITDNADEAEPDGNTARRIVELMDQSGGKPFFLGAGFHKPHLPWVAPRKYFEMYSPDMIKLPDTPGDDLNDIPPIALTHREDEKRMTDLDRKKAIVAYHAATSFMDAQVGVLLDALDRKKLWDNTVVLLFGDHGWHLNEHLGLWRKMTVFEESARAPLIVAAPGKKRGESCPRLVEWVDFYPTLVDLCGLPIKAGLDGESMSPLLANPQRKWKKAAYTIVRHQGVIGRSVRTDRFRYTEWGSANVAELYDHESDPKEYRNLAKDAKFAQTIVGLRMLLDNPELARPGA